MEDKKPSLVHVYASSCTLHERGVLLAALSEIGDLLGAENGRVVEQLAHHDAHPESLLVVAAQHKDKLLGAPAVQERLQLPRRARAFQKRAAGGATGKAEIPEILHRTQRRAIVGVAVQDLDWNWNEAE